MEETTTPLGEDEARLLARFRADRRRSVRPPLRDGRERALLNHWRLLRTDPHGPLWARTLENGLTHTGSVPGTETGTLFGDCPEARGRLLGMLRGCAVAETFVRRAPEVPRTSTVLSVVDELVRARAEFHQHGEAHPVEAMLRGQRCLPHPHGATHPECPDSSACGGGVADGEPTVDSRSSPGGEADPVTLFTLGRIEEGARPGTPEEPVNTAESAGAVPVAAVAAALWAENPSSALLLGERMAALTHGGLRGYRPAGLAAAVLFGLMRGGDPRSCAAEAVELAGRERVCPEVAEAVRLSGFRPAGSRPTRRNLEAAADCRTGAGALAVALRAVISSPEDFAGALRVAVDHGGDTLVSALLCGQLFGARHGPDRLHEVTGRVPRVDPLVERVTAEAVREFGVTAGDAPRRGESPPTVPTFEEAAENDEDEPSGQYRTSEVWQGLFTHCVLGCAVGEALGGAVAGDSWQEITDRYGPSGLLEYVPAGHPSGRIGSETQILLFTLEGMVRAGLARRGTEVDLPTGYVQHAYQRWLHTQHLSWPRAAGKFLSVAPEPDGWLVGLRGLFQTRTPGRTMMRTLIAFAKGQREMGDPQTPESDSDGGTALLRAVPAALWSADPAETFRVAAELAGLTHGHPDARMGTASLAVVVSRLLRGVPLSESVAEALAMVERREEGEHVRSTLATAVDLAEEGPVPPERVTGTFGTGFTAVGALGIGVYSALCARGDFALGIRTAVNHSGDSAVCGAVAGGLLAASAPETVEERWTRELELRETVERMATDAALEFGPAPPETPEWFERYPVN
ncbi:ADP-ribosylglycohydrolase family protein [Actinopolyspora mortivallis]|uniref:ADP-ribosylglycohydrolase family protein n=1 Tax=Actinopolyspora mortivallis TaxID=33906 RepID=UPI0003731315|nr:ADP-ribosylglycohydrolase family protein [Actinopolyspora mortivallis]